MKDKSAIRKIFDPAIPLTSQYHTYAKKLGMLIEQYLKDKDRDEINAFDKISTAFGDLGCEENFLHYSEGFKLGLALGLESAKDIFG